MAGMPKIPINPNVYKLIGISKFNGAAIKLYAYKMKPPKTIRLRIENIFFITFVHLS
jgi:hypothetical protein